MRDVVITLSESRALCIFGCIIDVDLALFRDSGKTFYVSCERSELGGTMWDRANSYWTEKGLRLPTQDEARVIYAHKAELDAALIVAGYARNYFQTSDPYWTSQKVDSYSSSYYYINMANGTISNSSSAYSFGVYVK